MTDDEFMYQLNEAKKHHILRRETCSDIDTSSPQHMYTLLWLQLLGLAETARFKRQFRDTDDW